MWKAKEPTFIIRRMERSRRHSLQNMKFPFILNKKGTVKAITYDAQSGKSGPVAIRRFDLPAADYKVVSLPMSGQISCLTETVIPPITCPKAKTK